MRWWRVPVLSHTPSRSPLLPLREKPEFSPQQFRLASPGLCRCIWKVALDTPCSPRLDWTQTPLARAQVSASVLTKAHQAVPLIQSLISQVPKPAATCTADSPSVPNIMPTPAPRPQKVRDGWPVWHGAGSPVLTFPWGAAEKRHRGPSHRPHPHSPLSAFWPSLAPKGVGGTTLPSAVG